MTDVLALLNDDPVAQRLLTGPLPARLAYVAKDGTPRVIPVGFHWDGRAFVLGTAPGSAKVAALEANPDVALSIDTSPPTWPPNALLVRGRARVSTVDGVFQEYLDGARKGIPEDEYAGWEAGVRQFYDQMVRIDIEPTWATVHDFETRIPKRVEELARQKFGGS